MNLFLPRDWDSIKVNSPQTKRKVNEVKSSETSCNFHSFASDVKCEDHGHE